MEFLKSTRFWKLVAIGVMEALVAVDVLDGDAPEAIIRAVELVLGSSVFIRTFDRFSEKLSDVKIRE